MRLLITKSVPETEPEEDEKEALKRAETDIANGDISDFNSVDWGI